MLRYKPIMALVDPSHPFFDSMHVQRVHASVVASGAPAPSASTVGMAMYEALSRTPHATISQLTDYSVRQIVRSTIGKHYRDDLDERRDPSGGLPSIPYRDMSTYQRTPYRVPSHFQYHLNGGINPDPDMPDIPTHDIGSLEIL